MFDVLGLFVGTAYAQGAEKVAPGNALDFSLLINYWPLFAIILVFYFLVFRPQQEKLDKQGKMLRALQKGDRVITNSGIYGKIVRVEPDNTVFLEISDGVQVRMVKHLIQSLVDPTPLTTDAAKPAKISKK